MQSRPGGTRYRGCGHGSSGPRWAHRAHSNDHRGLRAGGGSRTHDLTITSRLRYQLRHTGRSPRSADRPGQCTAPMPVGDALRPVLASPRPGWQAGGSGRSPGERRGAPRATRGGRSPGADRAGRPRARTLRAGHGAPARPHPPDTDDAASASASGSVLVLVLDHDDRRSTGDDHDHHRPEAAEQRAGPGGQCVGRDRCRGRRLRPAPGGRVDRADPDRRLDRSADLPRVLRRRSEGRCRRGGGCSPPALERGPALHDRGAGEHHRHGRGRWSRSVRTSPRR